MSSYQVGITVRLSVTFKNFDDTPVAPDAGTQKLTIFQDSIENEVFQANAAMLTAEGVTGRYHFDWVTSVQGSFIYEWWAMISGEPSLVRRTISIVEV